MKTTSSVSRKTTSAITGLILLVTTALTFTSCKKDEIQRPSSLQTATVNAKQMNLLPPPPLVFKSIKIDHHAAGTSMHDYSVTVNANGTALYEGRFNVHTKGEKTLEISSNDLNKINNLCIRFIEISRPETNDQVQERLMALPTVVTTYIGVDKSSNSMFMDFNNGQPVWLVMFRTEVEKILNISKLTDSNASVQVATIAN